MFDNLPLKTVFSLSADLPERDAGGEEPGLAALRPGALVRGSIREVCFLRKLSGGGAVLHVDGDTGVGQRLDLELGTGEQLGGRVEWVNGCEVGLRFDEPLDVFAIIARELVSQPGERRRMPRVELECPARLEAGSRVELVTTRDVSQGGVKVETGQELPAGTRVTIAMDGFRAIDGEVRWSHGGVAGIVFDEEIGWEELMPWLRERRDAALRRRRAAPARTQPAFRQAPPPPGTAPGQSVQLNLPARVREGTKRWNIEVLSITARHVEFESFAAVRLGTMLWIVLPGLEGWPARVTELDGYRFTCEFTQPLHPAVLERILAAARLS